ncbi:MAG: methyltransferase domain-containing protein [Desulfatirhabdiaceae bacterium]
MEIYNFFTRNNIRKLFKIVKHPSQFWNYLRYFFQSLLVKSITNNGNTHYRYLKEAYPEYLNSGNAVSFIAEKALQYCQGYGLDIGASIWSLPGAIPIQDEPDENAYSLNRFADNSLDFIFSSHCLEHLVHWKQAINLWIRKLKNGGILFLYLPHESMKLWRPGGLWVGNIHKWMPTVRILLPYLSSCGLEIIEYNPERDEYYSFHIIAKKRG